MKEVFIVSAVRTPIGSLGGTLSSMTAPQLGAHVIKEAVDRAGIKPEQVEEVIMGNVLSANIGQAPARQAAIGAGLNPDTICTTVNKVCASGMKAIIYGAQSIMLGEHDIVVAGGMESMSNVPYYLPNARNGYRLGNGEVLDGVIKDGLWDPYHNFHMGNAGELCAKEYKISRAEQDEFAKQSYERAIRATSTGKFKDEIAPVTIPRGKGESVTITEDEEIGKVKFEKIPQLKPAFQKDGTVTAANASKINDGASAVVLMSGEKVKELGIKPLAKFISSADAEKAPEWFTIAPTDAIQKLLAKNKINVSDVDYFEINEAFSVVCIANNKLLKLNPEKVNVNGGAVSLGHPLGCSGARIVVTLLNVLKQNDAKRGIAGICNGGGGASAVLIERV